MYGTGAVLLSALRSVPTAAGSELHDLDAELGGTRSTVDAVFADEGVGTIPLFAAANLLLKFGPEDKEAQP